MKEYLQLTDDEREDLHKQFLQEPDAFYEKAENDLLKQSLKQSYTERFLTMTRLMKLGFMLSKARIIRNTNTTGFSKSE
ncbi:MAG: hypothetical protein QM764_16975 [Chitinophagaceae bacterium]